MKSNAGSVVLGVLAATASHAGDDKPAATVVFVCEHGAAKSVVAAAHFNRMARERGLAVRAIGWRPAARASTDGTMSRR